MGPGSGTIWVPGPGSQGPIKCLCSSELFNIVNKKGLKDLFALGLSSILQVFSTQRILNIRH